ncbi:hypothetical protein KAJ61_05480 [Candidatus Parcubacteria bacterium]|nr:hypothetical protein [Candidatus Parcubacteria bacterium]
MEFIKMFLVVSICLVLFFVFYNKCENDFKIYSEKGYCEFNLKTCEGFWGCKKYDEVQVPCGSISTLCGEKVLCNCDE